MSGVVEDTVDPFARDNWEFAGWGTVTRLRLPGPVHVREVVHFH